jgi:hypothetical protein
MNSCGVNPPPTSSFTPKVDWLNEIPPILALLPRRGRCLEYAATWAFLNYQPPIHPTAKANRTPRAVSARQCRVNGFNPRVPNPVYHAAGRHEPNIKLAADIHIRRAPTLPRLTITIQNRTQGGGAASAQGVAYLRAHPTPDHPAWSPGVCRRWASRLFEVEHRGVSKRPRDS